MCARSHIHTRAECRLSARSNRWISSLPYSAHPFLHLSPHRSLSLSLSERVTFLPSSSPPLPSFSLLHLHVSVLQVPSSHITFLLSSFPLPFVLSWWVNSWPLRLTLCFYSLTLPSITSCQSSLPLAVLLEKSCNPNITETDTWNSKRFYLFDHKTSVIFRVQKILLLFCVLSDHFPAVGYTSTAAKKNKRWAAMFLFFN